MNKLEEQEKEENLGVLVFAMRQKFEEKMIDLRLQKRLIEEKMTLEKQLHEENLMLQKQVIIN